MIEAIKLPAAVALSTVDGQPRTLGVAIGILANELPAVHTAQITKQIAHGAGGRSAEKLLAEKPRTA
jgi:hypothetical protein